MLRLVYQFDDRLFLNNLFIGSDISLSNRVSKIKHVGIILLLVWNVYWLESRVCNHLHALVVWNVENIALALQSLLWLYNHLTFVLLLFLKDSELSLHAADWLVYLLTWLEKVVHLCFLLNYFELLNLLLTDYAWGNLYFLPWFCCHTVILLLILIVNNFNLFAEAFNISILQLLQQSLLTESFGQPLEIDHIIFDDFLGLLERLIQLLLILNIRVFFVVDLLS